MANTQRIVLILLCFSVLFPGLTAAGPPDMDLAAENEYLALFIDRQTTEIAVYDKRHDMFWYSNPQDRSLDRGRLLERLSSQFTILHNPNRQEKNNYRFSIAYNQFNLSDLTNGIRVDYQIVEEWQPRHYIPQMIAKTAFEERVLQYLDEDDRKTLLAEYNLIKLVPRGDSPHIVLQGLDKELVFGDYTLQPLDADYLAESERLAAMRRRLAEIEGQIADRPQLAEEKEQLEREIAGLESRLERTKIDIIWRLISRITSNRADIGRIDEIRHRDVVHLIDTPTYMTKDLPRFVVDSLANAIIETQQYTPIEVAEDHLDNNLDPPLANLQTFRVALEYTLDGEHLLIRMPAQDIEYPIEVLDRIGRPHTYPIMDIRLMEFFGAANDKSEDGYILVPDGSGALIYLNSGKTYAPAYSELVYGRDAAQDTATERQRYPQINRLPVFGLKHGDQAFLAIIEEGEALARIRADISGKTDRYNKVFPEFTLLPTGRISLDYAGETTAYQSRPYEGDFTVRYAFLGGDAASYTGMARHYQDYLINHKGLSPLDARDDIPFFLELVGSIPIRKPILGVPRTVIEPLTTYGQAKDIVSELVAHGVGNLALRYTGWLSGGVDHDFPNRVRLESAVGSKADLEDLRDFLSEQGFSLYPNVGFLYAHRDSRLYGFTPRQDASRYLNRLIARVYEYRLDVFTRLRSPYWYVVSPSRLEDVVAGFLRDYERLGIAGLSLADMGTDVNSDFRTDPQLLVDRPQAQDITRSVMETMRSDNLSLLVEGGNAYTLPYADIILNVPSSSSYGNIIDESIPFYQIAMHGLIDYAGPPVNLSANYRQEILRAIEVAAYPYFVGTASSSSLVKETRYDGWFALHVGDWLDVAVTAYHEMNEALGAVQNYRITHHERLDERVYATTYENDHQIIVNYNRHPVQIGNFVVGEESFIVLKEDDNED